MNFPSHDASPLFTVFALVGIALGVAFYFLPTIFAFIRKHRQKVPILLLNFFLGWTLIGWVICIVWAFTRKDPDTVVVVQQAAPPPYR